MTTDYDIKPEWAQAWAKCDSYGESHVGDCADLALHLLAALMEAEFYSEHELFTAGPVTDLKPYCSRCGQKSNWDKRHNNDQAAWDAAARTKLEELGR